ncbi:MAG: dienelactone hydrolase family protein [Pseudomonadota bacterium]
MPQVTLKAADGHEFSAYAAAPSGQAKGGIVVIQEIFGVNPHIRSVVDKYAAQGYFAIAPQIFDRAEANVELGYEDQADFDKGLKLAFQDIPIPDALKDVQAAVNAAAEHGRVGVVGYCYGGLITWLSACGLSGVTAASSYYGGGIAGEKERQPQCPIIMHFGEKDAHIPMSDVEAIKTAHPDIPVYVYDADHGFNCDVRGSYDQPSASTALERTLNFFSRHIDPIDDGDDQTVVIQN